MTDSIPTAKAFAQLLERAQRGRKRTAREITGDAASSAADIVGTGEQYTNRYAVPDDCSVFPRHHTTAASRIDVYAHDDGTLVVYAALTWQTETATHRIATRYRITAEGDGVVAIVTTLADDITPFKPGEIDTDAATAYQAKVSNWLAENAANSITLGAVRGTLDQQSLADFAMMITTTPSDL